MKQQTFGNYLKQNFPAILGAFALTYLAFFVMLSTRTVTVDEETWLAAEGPLKLWLLQGRFGVWLYTWLVPVNGNTPPLWNDILAVALWMAAGVIGFYCIWSGGLGTPAQAGMESGDGSTPIRAGSESGVSAVPPPRASSFYRQLGLLLALSFIGTMPYVTGEALSFSMMSVPESAGMLLAAVAGCLLVRPEKKKRHVVLAFLFIFLALCTYQAIVTVTIVAVVGHCLYAFYKEARIPWKSLGLAALLCAAAVLLYYLVCAIVTSRIGEAGYLSENYIGWKDMPPALALVSALANILRVSFGLSTDVVHTLANAFTPDLASEIAFPTENLKIAGGPLLCLATCLSLLAAIFHMIRTRGAGNKIRTILYSLLFMVSPFSLYVALGTPRTWGRMLVALPLMSAAMLFQLVKEAEAATAAGRPVGKRAMQPEAEASAGKSHPARIAVVLALAILAAGNILTMHALYRQSARVYASDVRFADEVMAALEEYAPDYPEKQLIFIGYPGGDTHPEQSSSVFDTSLFAWDGGNLSRIGHFLKIRGYEVQIAEGEERYWGVVRSGDQPAWPEEGWLEGTELITVRFSAPTEAWYDLNLPGYPNRAQKE